MKSRIGLILLAGAAAVVVSCASSAKKEPGPQWFSNMHRLSNVHLKLMPLASNGREFSNPARYQETLADLKEMASAAHAITQDKRAPDSDPLIRYSTTRFALETKQAYRSFEMNDPQWARYALNRASGYCIACHTRTDHGAKDYDMAWVPDLGSLSAAQRVDFLLANRRYKTALEEAKRLAEDTRLPKSDPRTWITTLTRALAMTVRVQKDPVESEKIATAVVHNRSAPFYIRSDASAWLRDIRAWKAEGNKPVPNRFKKAVALIKGAPTGLSQGRAKLITHLRASALLHDELERPGSDRFGEVLLYAGMVAQSLGDLNQGYVDQYYFESCIRRTPHSELAERCYDLLDASVQASSPFLELDPELEWYRLSELRKLSEVKNSEEPVWNRRSWEAD